MDVQFERMRWLPKRSQIAGEETVLPPTKESHRVRVVRGPVRIEIDPTGLFDKNGATNYDSVMGIKRVARDPLEPRRCELDEVC